MATKGYRYARCGPMASVLSLESYNSTANEVTVDVKTAPLHRADSAIVAGTVAGGNSSNKKSACFQQFPRVAGSEAVGIVSDSSVSSVQKGDQVWVAPPYGGWAEKVTAPSSAVHTIDSKNAALAPFVSSLLTANGLLKSVRLPKSGVQIVQNGGSSAVSLGVSALAQQKGYKVVTAATAGPRFAEAAARHKKYGSEVVEYNHKGMLKAGGILGSAGANLYLNGVGGRNFNDFTKVMAQRGAIVTYGAQNGHGIMFGLSNQIHKELSHSGFSLTRYLSNMTPAERQAELVEVLDAMTKAGFNYPTKEIKGLEKLPEVWDEVFVNGGSKAVLKL